MYDDKGIMGRLLEGLFVWIVVNSLMSQPLVKGFDDDVPHVMFLQDMIDLGLRCAEQDLAFGGLEQG